MADPTDAGLVELACDGDQEAYGTLVTRYQGHVYGLAYSLVGNWADAQDIAQEVFIRAFVNLDQLRDPARFAAWLRRVAFSVAMNWLKAFRPRLFGHLDGRADLGSLEVPDFRPAPPEVLEKRDLAEAVLQAVASLPPKYRAPLTMFHLDGLSYRKVASFLDIPVGTVKSLIHRAKEKLKAALPVAVAAELTPVVQEVFNEHKLPVEFARKVINGLEKMRWGGGERENSVMGALAAALQAIGEDVAYEFLMGLSGAAFRLQIAQPEWCPSAPHANCGFRCTDAVFGALDYELVSYETGDESTGSVDAARRAVIESIDKGVPAFHTSEEDSLIVGYEQNGEGFLVRPYAAGNEGYTPMTQWPWTVSILRKKRRPPDRHQCLLRSLQLAVELASTEKFGEYASGFKAYELWIEQLRDESRSADAGKRRTAMMANGHCYYSLLDARMSAAIYLRAIADEFSTDVAAHLFKAADLYDAVLQTLTQRCPTEIAPMPWFLKEGETWTQEMRNAQADILEHALSLDRQAVDEVDKALVLLE